MNNCDISKIEDFRNWVRTSVEKTGLKIGFIGKFPSSGTAFGLMRDGGDSTLEAMYKFIQQLGTANSPYSYTGISGPIQDVWALNLFPIVAQNDAQFINAWNRYSDEDKNFILDVTARLLRLFLDDVDYVIVHWGWHDPWKRVGCDNALKVLSEYSEKVPMLAARNSDGSPKMITQRGTSEFWDGVPLEPFPFQ